jgi:hypothetical protein
VTTALPGVLGSALDREARRALVEGRNDLDGIDFVEVIGNYPGSRGRVPAAPQQRTLLVHLLNGAVPADWDADRVRITGGVRADPRVNPVGVEWAYPALAVAGPTGTPPGPLPDGVAASDGSLVDQALPPGVGARRRVLAVRTTTSGDWSTYTLALLGTGGAGIPDGFDSALASAPFSFTVDCPSDVDCRPPEPVPAGPSGSPLQDYLARDYEALRTRLVDRLSTLLPRWTDRNPADPAVMLAELFAYLGDRLAYWQDAVGVEAYLGTARQRTSVRRHARLLDYAVHEGCSSRAWLALSTDIPTTLPAGAAVADTVPADSGVLPVEVHESGGTVFETVEDVALTPARNQVPLHSWGDPDHVLAAGTTAAFLGAPAGGGDLGLRAGDVLVLADFPSPGPDAPAGGPVESGDPGGRHAVRLDRQPVRHTDARRPDLAVLEIHWHPDDALPAPLRVSETAPDGSVQVRAVALANVALADHGASVTWEPLDPPQPTAGVPYRPRLPRPGLAFTEPPPPVAAAAGTGAAPVTRSAADLLRPDIRLAGAALTLDDGERLWIARPDLVASSRLDPHVVVELEGVVARLRFGDGLTGRAPATQATYLVRCRLGGGTGGNVAAGRLTRWVARADGSPAVDSGAVPRVWNPLPAAGGADPEDVAQVRQLAPWAFRTQLRAVTAADYAAAAGTVPGVQRSVDRRRWAGSWYVHEVTIDPEAARADDPAVPAEVTGLLEVRRMAGVDVEVARPVYVPLHIELFGCLAPGYLAADVEAQLLAVLSARTLPGGTTGLFHPDRFTFGQPLYVSDLVAAAMTVPGLAWVDVTGFARLGDPAAATAANLAAGLIGVGAREVLRCDSDPNDPEAGRVDVVLGGGS